MRVAALSGCSTRVSAIARVGALAIAFAIAAQFVCFAAESVTGVVKDRSGAVIPSAEVALNTDGTTLRQTTTTSGAFDFSQVSGNAGELTVSAVGFATTMQAWKAGDPSLVIVLPPAAIQQALDVTATRTSILPTGAED